MATLAGEKINGATRRTLWSLLVIIAHGVSCVARQAYKKCLAGHVTIAGDWFNRR